MNRYAWAILTALVILIAVPAQAEPSITFTATTLEVGDTWTDHSLLATSITFQRNDSYRDLPPEPRATSVDRTKTVKVREVTGSGKIGEIEVTYGAVVQDGVDRTSLFAGRTYVVSLKGNKATALEYSDGTIPPESEAEFVLWDNNRHEQVRAMNRTFGGETLVVGQTLRAVDPNDLIDADSGMTVSNFAMVLQSISSDGEEATFAITFDLANSVKKIKNATADDEEPFGSMQLALAGTLVAKKNSRIVSIDLSGPAIVTGTKAVDGGYRGGGNAKMQRAKTISGNGTSTLSTTYVYP